MNRDIFIPDWATHIAQDQDGMWTFFENKPQYGSMRETYWWDPTHGKFRYAYSDAPNTDWKSTLREL